MIHRNELRLVSILLGFAYVSVVGFLGFPINLQASIFYSLFFILLFYLIKTNGYKLRTYNYFLIFSGIILSLYLSVTTNTLISTITTTSVIFLLSLFQLYYFSSIFPDTIQRYFSSLFHYLKYFLVNFFSPTNVLQAIKLKSFSIDTKNSSSIWKGILISIPILFVFHFLFAGVNADYNEFVSTILSQLWQLLKYIFDIDFIWLLIKASIQSYIFYILLSIKPSHREDIVMKEQLPLTTLKIVMGMVIGLFLLFSSFQSKLLLVDIFKLSFHEVSKYVQQGFGELLMVTLIGYMLIQAIFQQLRSLRSHDSTINYLLSFFCLELLVIVIFISHKLFALQSIFGFKDQRIAASVGVFLIATTFVLILFRIWHRLKSQQVFKWQVVLTVLSVLLLNLINVDKFVTSFNTIRFYSNDTAYTDYSYLLGNSYDNTSHWYQLMQEARQADLPVPDKNYYWGHFSTSNTDYFGGSYSPICDKTNTRTNTYLENRYNSLLRKYDSFNLQNQTVSQLTTFNFREYKAYLFVKNNIGFVNNFLTYAKSLCATSN